MYMYCPGQYLQGQSKAPMSQRVPMSSLNRYSQNNKLPDIPNASVIPIMAKRPS